MRSTGLFAIIASSALAIPAAAHAQDPPGTPLASFTDAFAGDAVARSLVIDAQDRVLAVGEVSGAAGGRSVIARYLPDGTRDATFAGTGARVEAWGTNSDNYAAVALQPDGKIVVAGAMYSGPRNSQTSFVVRYLASGALDPSFGAAGKATVVSGGSSAFFPYDLAVQADGKVVVVGKYAGVFGAARLTASGALDSSFGSKGLVKVNVGGSGNSGAGSLEIQGDGKLVLGGDCVQTISGVTQRDLAVVRLNVNGSPDPAFGSAGARTVRLPGRSAWSGTNRCLRIQDDGRVVMGGQAGTFPYTGVVVRLLPDGALDAGFNGTGVHATSIPGGIWAIDLTPAGQIVTGGGGDDRGFTAIRFNADGTLDQTFNAAGTPGYIKQPILAVGDFAHAIAYRALDDTLLLAGRAYRVSAGRLEFGFLLIQN